MNFWATVGWLLFGGVLGYALTRWRILWVPLMLLLAVGFIADPTPPDLQLGTANGDESWWYTVADLVGFFIGAAIARTNDEPA